MPIYGFDEGKNKNEIDLDAKQNKHSTISITLTIAGWEENDNVSLPYKQIISVDGVTEDNTVIVTAAPGSIYEYEKCEVFAQTQADGELKFVCKKVPTSQMVVYLVILGV